MPTGWAAALKQVGFTFAMAAVLKLTYLIRPHEDISWLVINLGIYRLISYALHLLKLPKPLALAAPMAVGALALAGSVTCTTINYPGQFDCPYPLQQRDGGQCPPGSGRVERQSGLSGQRPVASLLLRR